jgi:hypothetical protein
MTDKALTKAHPGVKDMTDGKLTTITNCYIGNVGTSSRGCAKKHSTNPLAIASRYFFNTLFVQAGVHLCEALTRRFGNSQKSFCYNGGVAHAAGRSLTL